MSLRILLFILCFISATVAWAQTKTIYGTVYDTDGTTVTWASVMAKGTKVIPADTAGHYRIDVPVGTTKLVFSALGYHTLEVRIDNRTVVNVILEAITRSDRGIVTALNIIRTSTSLQSSITQISGDKFTLAREISVAAPLEGRVAGVNVTKAASGPAGSTRVVIRGAKSLGGSNQPLYVIDGLPMDNANFGQAGVWGGPDNGDGLTSISPDDIASMTVLKGASAANLYGSRGSGGVVLITTKKSSARKGIGVEFNSNFVAEQVINYTDFQNTHGAGGYAGASVSSAVARKAEVLSSTVEPDRTTAFDYGWNSQAWGPRFDGTDVVQPDEVIRKYSYAGDNWKRFYNTGTTFSNSIALTGGKEFLNARLSYTHLKNNSVIPNSAFNRDNIALSISSQLGKNLTLEGKGMYSHEEAKNRPMISDSPGNAIEAVYYVPGDQNIELYKGHSNKLGAVPPGMVLPSGIGEGGEFQATNNLWGQNPYWATYQFVNSDVRDRFITSGNLRYNITEALYVKGLAGIDSYTKNTTNVIPKGTGYQSSGFSAETETHIQETNLQWIVGFDKQFGNVRANTYVGGNTLRSAYQTLGHNHARYGINSLFASAEISYLGSWFVTATAREDFFIETLAQNHVLYPSIGASFVFTDRHRPLPDFLTFGKLRASYGQVGNAFSFAPYSVGRPYVGYFANPWLPGSGILPSTDDLKQTISAEFEFGLNVLLFESRLGLDVAYYDQTTKNDILYAGVSQATGFASTPVNVANLQNRGVEVLLTGTPVRGAVTWDVSLNFARNFNKVVSIIGGKSMADEEPRTKTVRIMHNVGQPYGMISGFVQSKTPDGRLIYDALGAPVTDGTYQILGNGVPNFVGGLNNSITYKSFSLDVLVDFKHGGQIYSGTNVRMTQGGFTKETLLGREGEAPLTVTGAIQTGADADGNAVYADFTKALTPGEAQNYWRQLGETAEDKFVYDASFIKLRQLTLSYSFPKSILGKAPIKSLIFSLVSRNLATLYKKTPNIDPESGYSSSNAQGLEYFGMPPTRSYGVNLRVVF